jgi:hypothetical protein
MVIYAATTFRCRHEYIATAEQGRVLFVCDQCHHRTELLPLHRGASVRRVMIFPAAAGTAHAVERDAHCARTARPAS